MAPNNHRAKAKSLPKPRGNIQPHPSSISRELDSPLWWKLPTEILCLIVENCDRRTLLSWSCTNQFFYEVASNILWETLRITSRELIESSQAQGPRALFVNGTYVDPTMLKREHRKLLYFMENNALRPRSSRRSVGFPQMHNQEAKLPKLRVKRLELDLPLRGSYGWFDESYEIKWTAAAVSKSLSLMPNLLFCSLEGPLRANNLGRIVQMRNLQGLKIRTKLKVAHQWHGGIYGIEHLIPDGGQILDLERLARLIHLQNLIIGRLAPGEADGLAKAVLKVTKLTQLSISAIPPAGIASSRMDFAGSCDEESPILRFLEAIWQGGVSAGAPAQHHLPQSLRHLVLRDVYRPGRSKNQDLLLDTISPCSNLTSLELNLMAIKHVEKFLASAQFPVLEEFAVGGCPHLLQKQGWEALGLIIPDLGDQWMEQPLVFKDFTLRHRQTLRRLSISLLMDFMNSNDRSTLRFNRSRLEGLWNAKYPNPEAVVPPPGIYGYREDWASGRCEISGACFVECNPWPITLSDVEDAEP